MFEFVFIPRNRKPILIGTNGSVKKKIEKKTKTKLTIRTDAKIEGEFIDVLKAVEIVKAIVHGFSPTKAFLLLKDNYQLEIIEFREHDLNVRKRILARVIGKNGTVKKNIEEKTKCLISVYEKTVSIIAETSRMPKIEKVIESLLKGKSHGYAYKLAEKNRKIII